VASLASRSRHSKAASNVLASLALGQGPTNLGDERGVGDVWMAGVEGRRGMVLEAELDELGGPRVGQLGDQAQPEVDARGDPSARDSIAIDKGGRAFNPRGGAQTKAM
jgi:hypothetical protein